MEDISRVGQSPDGLAISNSTTVIVSIGNFRELGEIFEDLRFSPYNIWSEI